MDVMGTWERHAHGLPTDPVSTVYHPTDKGRKTQKNAADISTSLMMEWNGVQTRCSRREPNSGVLGKIFKQICATEECGAIDPAHISVGSARKVFQSSVDELTKFAQTVAPSDVAETVRILGGWAEGSKVPLLHYTKAGTTNSNFALVLPGAEDVLLGKDQINRAILVRSLMAKGAAGQGATGLPEDETGVVDLTEPEVGTKRKGRKDRAVVDVSHSEEEDVMPPADPARFVTDSRGVGHDPLRVICSGRATINFAIPFLTGVGIRPSVLSVAPPRQNIELGQALVAAAPVDGRTGQPVGEFVGDLYKLAVRPPPGRRNSYLIDIGRGYGLDCTRSYAEGRCVMSAGNTAANLLSASGEKLMSKANNCHVATDWTVEDQPRLYLYLTKPIKGPEVELMWPYGSNYIPAEKPLTLENLEDFLPPTEFPAKKARQE